MKIFVVPGWYPSALTPHGGIFVRDQVAALAAVAPEHRCVVSVWGHDDGRLAFRDLRALGRAVSWFFSAPGRVLSRHPAGFWEVSTPALNWSPRIGDGGLSRIISACRTNFALAERELGRPDLIHAHVAYPAGVVAARLSAEHHVPYVLTEHMSPFPFPHLMRQGRPIPEIDEAVRQASAVIAVSDSLADAVARFGYGRPAVVPNVVDEQAFTCSTAPAAAPFVFASLGSLVAQKGFDLLLDAIAMWRPDAGAYRWRIGGEGPLGTALQSKARALGISHLIDWYGRVAREDVPGFFRTANAFVMPSLHETFGVVLVEALMTGRPVIATRCGGPQSIVDHRNGILVPVGDPSSLANAMKRVARESGRFDPGAIHAAAVSRFGRAAFCRRILEVYRSVLDTAA